MVDLTVSFRKRARITVENQHGGLIHAFFYTVNYSLTDKIDDDCGYFHAQWRRTKYSSLKEDHVVLDINGKGHYVGTYIAWTALERYWYGEGEFKFFIDDDTEYPTICGTGVEDYVGGAWGFYERMTMVLFQEMKLHTAPLIWDTHTTLV